MDADSHLSHTALAIRLCITFWLVGYWQLNLASASHHQPFVSFDDWHVAIPKQIPKGLKLILNHVDGSRNPQESLLESINHTKILDLGIYKMVHKLIIFHILLIMQQNGHIWLTGITRIDSGIKPRFQITLAKIQTCQPLGIRVGHYT